MDELSDIKKVLKKWESVFIEDYKRKPSKTDIDDAPQHIKDAYQKYRDLKRSTDPGSQYKNDKTGDSAGQPGGGAGKTNNPETEVWGHEFDKKCVTKESQTQVIQNKETKSAFLQNLGKKMFEKSLKLTTQQTNRKRPTHWRKPDTPNTGVSSIPMGDRSQLDNSEDTASETDRQLQDQTSVARLKDSNLSPGTEDIPVLKLQSKGKFVAKENKVVPNVEDSDPWLKKFKPKSKLTTSVLPKNLSKLVSKHKERYKGCLVDEHIEENNEIETDKTNTDEESIGDVKDSGHSWHVPVKNLIIEDMVECGKTAVSNSKKSDNLIQSTDRKRSFRTQEVKDKASIDKQDTSIRTGQSLDESENEVIEESRSDSRSCVSKITKKRKHQDSMRENHSNDGSVSPDTKDSVGKGNLKKRKGKAANVKPASKRQKLDSDAPLPVNTMDDDDNDDDGYNEEGGMRSKPVKSTKTKAVSNDNFIRLNMKVKTYKRKGRHMTGQQYKRQMWKQKMKDRSKSYGDACFKCGQSGHWANKCPGVRNQTAESKEPVLDEDFPSMQEAAQMARGVKLEERKNYPSKASKSVHQVTTDAVNQPDDQDVELEIQSEIVRNRKEVEPVRTAMEPLLDIETDEPPDFVLKGLKKFGFESFRPGQKQAVMRILRGQSTLVVLSTGGGKSLCYQLPAYLYAQRSSCITLVVSPLVSLMEDQVTGLPNGVKGVCLHTNMTANQRENVLSSVKDGKAQFLLVSPEAVAGGSMTLISSMASLPPVAFVCIDEAHCLSEWSHNFRPSYLRLCKVLREKLGIQCFLGLTATATLSTASDVSRHLNITDFKTATVRGSPIPENLQLSVSRDEDREQALVNLLQGERFCNLDSIIIYCTRRDQTDKVATIIRTCLNKGAPVEARKGRNSYVPHMVYFRLKASGDNRFEIGTNELKFKDKIENIVRKGAYAGPKLEWDAESYHAGLSAAQRKRVQNAFMSGKLRVVVATVAFGMGLDKADVRGVVHYNMPKSFESYVQEIGRAGRDGNLAQCHVFLDSEGKDLCELRRHTYANTVDYKTLKKLVQKIFAPCRCKEVHEKHARAAREVPKASNKADQMDDEFDDTDVDLIEACQSEGSKVRELETEKKALVGGNAELQSCHRVNNDDSNKDGSDTSPRDDNCNNDDNMTSGKDGIDISDKYDIGTGNKDEITECGEDDVNTKTADSTRERICPGHERALPIEQTVMELDVKEEGISTLLCYLELHSTQWLENLPSVYAHCKIQCYAGPGQLQAIAKKCPPIAVAIARARKEGKSFANTNTLEFPVVEISDCMGWDSGPVKKELKLLQWDFSSGIAPKRTGVMIEFTDLSYHFRSPGDFTSSELDDVLEFLHTRVQRQEKSEIQNLSRLYKALKSVSHKNYWMCADTLDITKNDKLKSILNEYFDTQTLVMEEDGDQSEILEQEPIPEYSRGQVISDIHQFVNLYGEEHSLTGRAIARIFHGISSPCFPATTWGRVRRFWRSHLNVDFNELMKTATKELIMLRR